MRLPASLTASQLLRLADDPDAFARELARPMPRPPQPAARRGTRFHAWVEARFEELTLPMLDPDELPGADAEIADERDLEELKEAFERTEYAHRTPYRVEAPFQLSIAGRVVRGRIDAVYRHERAENPEDPGDGDAVTYEIVDWKTGRSRTADPLQLAVYRLAWAEQQGVPWSPSPPRSCTSAPARWSAPSGSPAAPNWSGCCSTIRRTAHRTVRKTRHRTDPEDETPHTGE